MTDYRVRLLNNAQEADWDELASEEADEGRSVSELHYDRTSRSRSSSIKADADRPTNGPEPRLFEPDGQRKRLRHASEDEVQYDERLERTLVRFMKRSMRSYGRSVTTEGYVHL